MAGGVSALREPNTKAALTGWLAVYLAGVNLNSVSPSLEQQLLGAFNNCVIISLRSFPSQAMLLCDY